MHHDIMKYDVMKYEIMKYDVMKYDVIKYDVIPAFYYLSGWWVGVLDEIKAFLSPAGAWLWAELGKKNRTSLFCVQG